MRLEAERDTKLLRRTLRPQSVAAATATTSASSSSNSAAARPLAAAGNENATRNYIGRVYGREFLEQLRVEEKAEKERIAREQRADLARQRQLREQRAKELAAAEKQKQQQQQTKQTKPSTASRHQEARLPVTGSNVAASVANGLQKPLQIKVDLERPAFLTQPIVYAYRM